MKIQPLQKCWKTIRFIHVLLMSTSLVFFLFFLQSKILYSKIYKTIIIITEILKAIFNIDIICFHTFDHALRFYLNYLA